METVCYCPSREHKENIPGKHYLGFQTKTSGQSDTGDISVNMLSQLQLFFTLCWPKAPHLICIGWNMFGRHCLLLIYVFIILVKHLLLLAVDKRIKTFSTQDKKWHVCKNHAFRSYLIIAKKVLRWFGWVYSIVISLDKMHNFISQIVCIFFSKQPGI